MSDYVDTKDAAEIRRWRLPMSKALSVQPLITVKPSSKPVVFYSKQPKSGKKLIVRVGCVAKNRSKDDGDGLCPGMHIDLWHLILVLAQISRNKGWLGEKMRVGVCEVWRHFARTNSKPSPAQLDKLARLWDELDAMRMSVCLEGDVERIVDLVHYQAIRMKTNFGDWSENVVSDFSFDENFLHAVFFAESWMDVRLDVLSGITSTYVRAAYLWLPSKAVRCQLPDALKSSDLDSEDPVARQLVKFSSEDLFAGFGETGVPKWERKKLLTQNKSSILSQLHGLPLLRQGLCFGVASWDDGDDFWLGLYTFTSATWVPAPARKGRPKPGAGTALATSWELGGGSMEAYYHWLNRKLPKLESDMLDQMAEAGVKKIESYLRFYQMCLALLGPDAFRTSALGRLRESQSRNADAGGLFRTILLDCVRSVASQRTKLYLKVETETSLPGFGPLDSSAS